MSYHGVIYKFTNKTNGKVYIGMTTSLHQRCLSHVSRSKHGSKTPFHNALRKYGIDGFSVSLVGVTNTREELQELERSCISAYHSTDKDFGYNLSSGGDGMDGSLIQGDRNPMRTEEVRQKFCGDNNWTRKPGADLSYMLGENNPAKRSEVKEKISLARKGVPIPKIQGENHYNARRIMFMGREYGSIMDAVRDTGYSRETVSLRADTDWTPDFKKQRHVSKTSPEKWAEMCAEASKRKSGVPNVKICGGNNVNAKSVVVRDVLYSSIREASDAEKVHPDTIRNWAKTCKFGTQIRDKE